MPACNRRRLPLRITMLPYTAVPFGLPVNHSCLRSSWPFTRPPPFLHLPTADVRAGGVTWRATRHGAAAAGGLSRLRAFWAFRTSAPLRRTPAFARHAYMTRDSSLNSHMVLATCLLISGSHLLLLLGRILYLLPPSMPAPATAATCPPFTFPPVFWTHCHTLPLLDCWYRLRTAPHIYHTHTDGRAGRCHTPRQPGATRLSIRTRGRVDELPHATLGLLPHAYVTRVTRRLACNDAWLATTRMNKKRHDSNAKHYVFPILFSSPSASILPLMRCAFGHVFTWRYDGRAGDGGQTLRRC